MMVRNFSVRVPGQGLHEITDRVSSLVRESDIDEGICAVFIRHTSASLIIQENADPSARIDLENWINRMIPDGDPNYTHTLEGADDMPAHIKAAITATSLTIPILRGRLVLGTWQGIYIWEHRHRSASREIVVYVGN
jgi:secondary thiamine-phosphate synthase enzyme